MRRATLATTGLAVAGLVVAMLIGTRTPAGTEITLHFTDTTGLYVGNDVEVIGVPVGTVTAIEPRGTSVEVTARLDDDVPIAADTGAVIMQSALVTDRFVELTTPWTAGPRLEAGATIGLDRTRSPVNVDDIVGAVDELVVALQDTADGSTVGDLLAVSAQRLDGQGARIADTIDAAAAALGTVDALGDDALAVTGDLEVLVGMLAERDTAVQQLAASVADASTVLASQRQDLTATLTALQSLTATAGQIVTETQGLVVSDLDRATDVLATLADRTAEIGQTYDVLPLVAENLTRAYDPDLRRTRIRVDVRNTGPFSPVARTDLCVLLLTTDCDLLTNTSGTGILDPLLGWIPTTFPGDL
jgi:phospholipid/cholesterol/gamma-HCH transport system substrate-binding protein